MAVAALLLGVGACLALDFADNRRRGGAPLALAWMAIICLYLDWKLR